MKRLGTVLLLIRVALALGPAAGDKAVASGTQNAGTTAVLTRRT
jgi:hypothetical protein